MRMIHVAMLGVVLLIQTGCRTSPLDQDINASSANGSWTGEWRSAEGGYVERFSLVLNQNGDAITGTGIDDHGEPAQVKGTIVDHQVRITIWNQGGSAVFAGVQTGDRINGTWTMDEEKGPFWIKRKGPQNQAPEDTARKLADPQR